MRLPLLKACIGILAHIKEKYPVYGLHIDLAKLEQAAQVNSLFTGVDLRGMMEKENTMMLIQCFRLL